MAQKIGIGVEAQLDVSSVEQQINGLGQKIAQANKTQFTPVSVKSVQDVDNMIKRFEQLLKVHGELNRRIKATGQTGKAPWSLDYGAMFPDESVQNRQIQKVLQYTAGATFHAPVPPVTPPGGAQPPGGPGAPGGPQGPSWQDTAAQVANAGARAAGPVGGVVANSVSTGMSAGFGAGLMGLLGGMLALGVGKLVSGVMEKIDEAETNSIAMDRLKRTLGDVNVSFAALKSVVHAGADNLKITYAESEKLATQFTKLGNVTGEGYKSLADELGVGVGMSRAFGLDPSQGVGVMGQMRGLGITSSTQESRRFALLIGETIGKSGAFAKADEVMDAIASFAASQTRANMGAANVAGYAGMLSGMVGSGIAGLDPQGAAGLLARVNASLSAGGAKGEASQFFTALVGNDLGLDPIQTQILREGGAFATNSGVFGQGSVYSRYMGEEGPAGDQTLLQSTLDRLNRQRFASDERQDKLLRAQAAANHLGVNVSQAMALLSVEPNAMGEMQDKFGDLSKLSATGIGNISKALYGKTDDVQALARSLKGRTDVAAGDKEAITQAEKSGDESKLRDVLAELSARYGQERTMGSDIRDSKNALDNIKTSIADQLVPLTSQMRLGIMHIAGKGEKSSDQVMREVIELDSKERQKSIKREYDSKTDPLYDQLGQLEMRRRSLDPMNLNWAYRDKPEVLEQKHAERREVERQIVETEKRIADLQVEREDLLRRENERRRAEIEQMEKDSASRAREDLKPKTTGGETPVVQGYPSVDRMLERGGASSGASEGRSYKSPGASQRGSAGAGAGADALATSLEEIKDPTERANVKAMLDAISVVEGAGYNSLVGQGRNNDAITDLGKHPNKVGIVTPDGPSTAAGRYQITNQTWRGVAADLGLKDFSPESQDKAAIELIRRRGALEDVKRGDFAEAARKLGSEWQGLPTGASPNQGKSSWKKFNNAIADSLARQEADSNKIETKPLPPLPSKADARGPAVRDLPAAAKPASVPSPAREKPTPIPGEAREARAQADQRFIFDAPPIEVIHRNERGEMIRSESLPVEWRRASPFGTERFV